ncbi:MAG: sigma-70 family RNA polymerase sigma factor [Candidatus Aminicenantes bacterium]|nr:MAG: sigma-70 family RNA polymerase sigma factor [Candidatus Aminicenantes bacterium]
MEALPDDQLVILARKGDVDAFTELARRHQEKIFRTVLWMTKNQQDADDLCQEAFLNAFKHLKNFKQRSSFATWIYRIAVNLTLNFLKRKMREKKRSVIPVEDCFQKESGSTHPISPENISLRKELRQRLNQAIDSLPDPYKMSFFLVVFQGMAHGQAAEVLGCSENTISWRMYKARKMLQSKLLPYLGGNE